MKLISWSKAHINPILKSLHWLKVNECIEYKLLSLTYKVIIQPLNLVIFTTLSLQPPRSTHSSFVVTVSCPPTISTLKITDRSFRYASPRLWNQLPDLFRQPHHSRLDSPSHPLLNYLCHHPHSRHPSLLHSSTPGSKPTFTTNPSHLKLFLPTGLPHDKWTGLDLSRSSFYF